jgi:hypothetical protein
MKFVNALPVTIQQSASSKDNVLSRLGAALAQEVNSITGANSEIFVISKRDAYSDIVASLVYGVTSKNNVSLMSIVTSERIVCLAKNAALDRDVILVGAFFMKGAFSAVIVQSKGIQF